MSSLADSLPAPRNRPTVEDDTSDNEGELSTAQLAAQQRVTALSQKIPPYGQRRGWKPTDEADYGDGGAYPECPVAQYPLELGRKRKTKTSGTLTLQVDGEGKVRYDAIARQGHGEDRHIQSTFNELVPLESRTDVKDKTMERPSQEEVADTAERTRLALEKLVNVKVKAAQGVKNGIEHQGNSNYVRYTPGGQGGDGQKQRIIKMTDVVEDPLEPPRFKGKKVPRGPPSPPAPVLRSPPRKVTAQEQKDWMIPPCVSNWKNNKGYTIPLDKRLAADGRGLQDTLINDRFAQFSEALYIADRHAREEVRQRALMQQRIAQKEKEAKEENLRMLAQRAREERTGFAMPSAASPDLAAGAEGSPAGGAAPGGAAGMAAALAGYGSDSDEESEDSGDEAGAAERAEIRRERRKERERELRMNNMGQEQRAKVLAKASGRDISEKIALGLAKPTMSKESMLDSRLFNREQLNQSFGDEDSYNLYDRPLFSGSSAAAAIYKPRGANVDDDGYEVGTDEGISRAMQNDRFGLGVAGKGFEGADHHEVREGPVAFEKDTADPFGVNAFLEDAKKGTKRGLQNAGDAEEGARKRARDDDD